MTLFLVLAGLFILITLVYIFKLALKVYSSAHELTHPIRHQYDLKIPYTYNKFEFITSDGVKLSGIEYQPMTDCKGTVLACHYLGGSKESILVFVESLIKNGYRILSFDNRNHGESDTVRGIKVSLQTDFDAFYNKIKSMGIKGPFGIMGFSMGAGQALWAIGKYSDIKAVITDSGPLLNVAKYFNYVLDAKKTRNPISRAIFIFIFLHYIGFSKMARRTKKILKELRGKQVLLIHGENDNIISVDDPKLAFSLLRSSKTDIWIVPRSRHLTNRNLNQSEYDERIVNFFDKNIAGKQHL